MGSGAHSLKREYYDALRQLTLELAGIQLGRDHTFQIETRLAGLARNEGFPSLADMIEELFASGHNRLAVRVVSTLLERDARFFSDLPGLGVFLRGVLPRLADSVTERTPRVLAFGCGSGQDVWSLAMLARQFADKRGVGVSELEFVGVDYPGASLERARAGVYTHFEVQRGLPASQLVRHFVPQTEGHGSGDVPTTDWRVGDRLREGVSFGDAHLLSKLDGLGEFDCVVLRGSLSRYSGPARVRVMRNVAAVLREGGMLLVGTEDTLEEGWALHAVDGQRGLFAKRTFVPDVAPQVKRTRFGPG